MFGVVLWSDPEEHKAVIWCEDHGDLAFYHQPESGGQVALDAGDWVQFDMAMENKIRLALNPRLIAEGVFPGLADNLATAETPSLPDAISQPTRHSAKIVPFRRPGNTPHRVENGAAVFQA